MAENKFTLRPDKIDPDGPVVLTVKLHMPYAHLAERVAWALKNSCWGCVEVEVVSRPPRDQHTMNDDKSK
jgi:hypothetical protein